MIRIPTVNFMLFLQLITTVISLWQKYMYKNISESLYLQLCVQAVIMSTCTLNYIITNYKHCQFPLIVNKDLSYFLYHHQKTLLFFFLLFMLTFLFQVNTEKSLRLFIPHFTGNIRRLIAASEFFSFCIYFLNFYLVKANIFVRIS